MTYRILNHKAKFKVQRKRWYRDQSPFWEDITGIGFGSIPNADCRHTAKLFTSYNDARAYIADALKPHDLADAWIPVGEEFEL